MSSPSNQLKKKRQDGKGLGLSSNLKFIILIFLASLFILIGYNFGLPHYYLGWFSFFMASFSVAGNDAIQTIGTFIESKRQVHWLPKTIVFCSILLAVLFYSYYQYGGEIHFGRLSPSSNNKGFPYPEQFNLLQLFAPIILVIITRLKAPISTTFLVLSLFGSQNVDKMLFKSFIGYGVAFGVAVLFWVILAFKNPDEYNKDTTDPKEEKFWGFMQWLSTAGLWVAWLYQDMANIAVYIPRQINMYEFLVGFAFMSLALIIIIIRNGGEIQELVSNKTDTNRAKAATLIDITYAAILFVFGVVSKMPMSTTWVFLGLLAGRELILHVMTKRDEPYLTTFRKVGKDVLLASLGISVSIGFFILSMVLYPKSDDTPWQDFLNFKSTFYTEVVK